MVEIDTLFQTKTAKKTPFSTIHTYIAYIRDHLPPRAKNALQIMSLAAYASETKKEYTLIHKWLTYKVGHALQTDNIRKRVRDGPLEKLWGGGRAKNQKKKFMQDKIKWKKFMHAE